MDEMINQIDCLETGMMNRMKARNRHRNEPVCIEAPLMYQSQRNLCEPTYLDPSPLLNESPHEN